MPLDSSQQQSRVMTLLHQHARQRPAQLALRSGSGELTYAQLAQQVDDMANWLLQLGCNTVGFQLDNGPAWVITDLAALAAGVNIVPIPGFFSAQQLAHVISDARIDLLLTDQPPTMPPGWQPRTPPLANSVGTSVGNAVTCLQLVTATPAATPQSQAFKLTYTSGSTGTPKGVCLPTATIDRVAAGIVSALANISINQHLCLLPLATLLENIAGLYAPLMRGITVQVPSLAEVGLNGASLDIEAFCKTLNQAQADSIILVPQLLTALVTLTEFGMLQPGSLQMIAVGGGRISEQLLARASALGLPVYQGYGLSECCSVLTLNLPGANRPGSVGRPLPHAQLRISAAGEIEAAGSTMAGYLGDALPAPQWYPTGDLGYVDADGYVYVTGRRKQMFITSFGRNVNPEWVEAALTQQAMIAHALVFGEARDHNVTLLWLRYAQPMDVIDACVQQVNAELPDYARSHAVIVMPEPLPAELLTANGRLRRQPALDFYQAVITAHYEQSSTETGEQTSVPPKTQTNSTHEANYHGVL